MAWFRKIRAGLVKSEITEFVGEYGHIFYNDDTGELRYSDGVTPGGLPLWASTGAEQDITLIDVAEYINNLINTGELDAPKIEAELAIVSDNVTSVTTPLNLQVGSQEIYLNGVRLSEGSNRDYAIDATTINFLNGWELFINDTINIVYIEED